MKVLGCVLAAMAVVLVFPRLMQPAQAPGRVLAPVVWRDEGAGAVREASYDPSTRVLKVSFVTGREYAHQGVSPECAAAFLNSPEKAQFYSRHIRKSVASAASPARGRSAYVPLRVPARE